MQADVLHVKCVFWGGAFDPILCMYSSYLPVIDNVLFYFVKHTVILKSNLSYTSAG